MTKPGAAGRAIALAALGSTLACGPKVANEPPPQTPGSIATSADGGLPPVPLERKGVIVPSDVKMQPPPQDPSRSPAPLGNTPSPGGN